MVDVFCRIGVSTPLLDVVCQQCLVGVRFGCLDKIFKMLLEVGNEVVVEFFTEEMGYARKRGLAETDRRRRQRIDLLCENLPPRWLDCMAGPVRPTAFCDVQKLCTALCIMASQHIIISTIIVKVRA